jgi:threonine aldolase
VGDSHLALDENLGPFGFYGKTDNLTRMSIDLRSDTLTKPSVGMRSAMASAEVGDDVYGEDPTVNSLEERVAKMFGKEAGLFTPTGSMANQLGIRLLVKPGEELLCEEDAHVVRAELGAGAAQGGITTRTWHAERGLLNAVDPIRMARPDAGAYLVSTTAIAIENTHNFGGGTVQSITEIASLYSQCREIGISLHLDGARIWNAHIASSTPLLEYGKYFETISVCLSKGLGAPIGSVLLSTKENIAVARVWRKRLGAGMRQVGVLASAAHYALDHNITRLAEDHRHAQILAKAIHSVSPDVVDPKYVDSNIVGLNLKSHRLDASQASAALREEGVLSGALGPKYLRLVTHLDVSTEQIEIAATKLVKILAE